VLAALCARLAAGDPVGSVLTATLSRHLSAEEQYLYPAVRAVLSDGGALADAESAALRAGADPASAVPAHIDVEAPHPWTPRTPPWNKLVDPLVGAVDKVRDAATGRATRVGDLRKAGGGERAGT